MNAQTFYRPLDSRLYKHSLGIGARFVDSVQKCNIYTQNDQESMTIWSNWWEDTGIESTLMNSHVCFSETNGNTRSNTPRRAPSVSRLAPDFVKRDKAVEEFPEFPPAPQDYDPSSYVDETMSIGTSIEDESNIDFEFTPDDDLNPTADLAEEAASLDDDIVNDRMYKALMAKNTNTLNAELNNVAVVVNIFNKNTLVMGRVDTLGIDYQLNIPKQNVYDAMKMKLSTSKIEAVSTPQVTFEIKAPADSTTSFVNLNVVNLSAKMDDEIVSHLGAFAFDDQTTENRVRLSIAVQKSNIEIKDRKKKKPMRIKIRDIVIEQDEDARTDVEED